MYEGGRIRQLLRCLRCRYILYKPWLNSPGVDASSDTLVTIFMILWTLECILCSDETWIHLDGALLYHKFPWFSRQFFDQDGSGAIDTKELGTIMRQLGAKLSDAEIDLLVKEADVDGDGQVDINEVSWSPANALWYEVPNFPYVAP